MNDVRRVKPIEGTLDATVVLPGSKSLTNRALIIAALANGESRLHGVGISDDTEAMIVALRQLGVSIKVDGTEVHVGGSSGLMMSQEPLDARMSGTSSRFLLPVLALVGGGTIDGHAQLRSRPMGPLTDALRSLGSQVDGDHLPIAIDGAVTGGPVTIDSSVSSQFVSALLLAGPAMAQGLELKREGEAVSTPYIDMTIAVMAAFGATVSTEGANIIVSPGGYTGRSYEIEPDASTATYPLAAAAIVGGRVKVAGLGSNSLQGDTDFSERVLSAMGADVTMNADSVEVRGSGLLDGIQVDLADMSDTAPTFAALAANAQGTSVATGIGFIKEGKESNRVENPITELAKLGIQGQVDDDGFTIVGGEPSDGEVDTYDDHRMAMSLALLGLVGEPVSVRDPGCTAKTFPGFWDMLDELAASARQVPLVLAIDGPAGSGKSTVAKMLAERLGIPHLDTGAMYRAVTTAVLRADVPLDDHAAMGDAAERADITVGKNTVHLNGEDVTAAIREPQVSSAVSAVAAVPRVRRVLVESQRQWATIRGAAVIEGRDIGTAVFPAATLKIYLEATVEERARRRAAETGDQDIEAVKQAIAARDEFDMSRETDPLTVADGAHVVDTTGQSIPEVIEAITSLWEKHRV